VWARFRLGQRADAEQALAEYHRLAAESREGIAVYNSLNWDAAIAIAEGRFDDGKRIAAEAQDHGGRHNAIVALGYGGQILAARAEQGAVDKVIRGLRQMGLLLDVLPAWRAMLVGVLVDVGEHSAAATELERMLADDGSPLPNDSTAPLAVRYLPEACRQLSE
jgi:hypothetical protein